MTAKIYVVMYILKYLGYAQRIGNSSKFNFMVNSSLTEIGELPSSLSNDKY